MHFGNGAMVLQLQLQIKRVISSATATARSASANIMMTSNTKRMQEASYTEVASLSEVGDAFEAWSIIS